MAINRTKFNNNGMAITKKKFEEQPDGNKQR